MHRYVTATAFGILLTAVVSAQQPAPAGARSETEQALIAQERTLYEAIERRDKQAVEALVDSQGVWTTPTGFVPMSLLVNGLESFDLPKWSAENPRVVWADGDSALLLYARPGGGTFAQRPLAPMMLASTLWSKRSGRWRAVHHQETALER